MKSVSVREPSVVSVNDVQGPVPGPGEILVRMHACGICGSDLEKVYGQYGQPSMRLGHEPAGVIESVGAGVAGFEKGDRVFTHHHVPCYDCHLCRHGNETMCPKYYKTNLSPCGLSEEYVVPAWNVSHGGVLKLSDSTSFEEAAMIEPLACCVRAWEKCRYRRGDSVAVFGAGPTGMMHLLLARAKGFAKIFCLDINDFRLGFAEKFGVTRTINSADADRAGVITHDTDADGVDMAVVATSSLAALKDAIGVTRRGGTVMMFGVPSKGATMSLDMGALYSREIMLATSYAASDADTAEALRMIESAEIDVRGLITHTYGINDSQKAFDHARSGDGAMKIIITK